jgi:hypothetical protein
MWSHPLYKLSCWWNGGRSIKVLEVSSTGNLAHVEDTVTGRQFCMSRVRMSNSYPGELLNWDADFERIFRE